MYENIKVIFGPKYYVNCKNKEDVLYTILDEYRENSEVCVGEFLNTIIILGLSVQDVVDIFASVMKKIENDEVVQFIEKAKINRWEW